MCEKERYLVDLILEWWEEEQYRTTGPYGEYNVYDPKDAPEFVKKAMVMRGHCILYSYDSTSSPDESIINGGTVYNFVKPKLFVEPKMNERVKLLRGRLVLCEEKKEIKEAELGAKNEVIKETVKEMMEKGEL